MSKELAQRVERIKPSPTLAVSARAEELQQAGKDIINLGVGEPDFDTPQHIKDAAIKAIKDGHTKYTAVDGIRSLKVAIVEKFARENRLHYELNEILVSCGAKHSLFNLCEALLEAGDEVIIPAPYWVSYSDMVLLADARPIILSTDASQHYKITPEQLTAAITPKTRLLFINSPSNPTGMAYTHAELKALSEVLLRHPHVSIVSDDIYEHTLWNHLPFANILNVCPELKPQCIVVNGVSKAYAMTGWRIGYAAGPAKIIGAMKKAQSQSTSNPASISQYAALAALTGDQSCIPPMVKAYKERHDYLYKELKSMPGVDCLPADGTFYIFPCVTALLKNNAEITGIHDDLALSNYLLNEGVALVPGSAFGTPDHLRLSYAASMEHLKKAIERMRHAFEKMTSKALFNKA